MLTEAEVERRVRRMAQMRIMFLESRRAAKLAWLRGELPYPPSYDIRSDVEYWERLRKLKDVAKQYSAK